VDDHLLLHKRHNDAPSLRDFGAMLDGTSDDTAAWRSALAAERVIHIPAGVSLVTGLSAVDVSALALIGAPGAVLKLADDSNSHLFHATRCRGLRICGLAFDGNKANQSSGLWCPLRMDECDDGMLDNVRIWDATNVGAAFRGCAAWVLLNVHTARCGMVALGQTAFGIAVQLNVAGTVPSQRFQIAQCSDAGSGFDEGEDQQGGGLFLADESADCHVIDYISRDSNKYGLKVQGTGHILETITVRGAGGRALALQGNAISVNGYHAADCGNGITIAHFVAHPDAKAVQVSNVQIERAGFDGGIDITNLAEVGPMTGVQLANVRVQGSERFGIRVRGGVRDVQIIGATVSGCTTDDVAVVAGTEEMTGTEQTPANVVLITALGVQQFA